MIAGPAAAPVSPWGALVDERLAGIARRGQWRSPRQFDALGPSGRLDGRDGAIVSFASNDYLGLSAHRAVAAAAQEAIDRWGTGSGASPLVTGSRPVQRELEAALAAATGCEAALCFPTGFAANLGVLGVLGAPGVHVVSDALNHASIIDGCRMSRAQVSVYGHGDAEQAAALLAATPGPSIVVTDTVFSMDGDVAPLADLAAACRRHGALLLLDEAHAVLGPAVGDEVGDGVTVVRTGTLSKTLGSLGGVVCAARPFIELLVNAARPYIFSTAPPPAAAAAALAALRIVESPEGARLRARLAALVGRVAPGHTTPIVPVVLGAEDRALAASAALLDGGLWVPAIRPPTVPPGTSRLRVTLSAAHTDEQVDRLVVALADVRAGTGGTAGRGGAAGPVPERPS